MPPELCRAICHSANIYVDPGNILPDLICKQFGSLHAIDDMVFDPKFPGYNASAGNFKGVVDMGPVQPPQRNGPLPQYSMQEISLLNYKNVLIILPSTHHFMLRSLLMAIVL